MARWFRFYDNVVNDPKVQRLPGEKFKAWVNLLCLASSNDGVVPPLADIAFTLRLSEDKASSILDELCAAGLLDPIEVENAPMSYSPHNWGGRQFKSDVSTGRVKRFRERDRNGDETFHHSTLKRQSVVSETMPETDTESEQKETREDALVDDWPSNYRDVFWERYPNKAGKKPALKKIHQIRRQGVAWREIIAGLEQYIRTKPPDREWMNPLTFLNQERWADQPATVIQLRRIPDV